MPGQQKEFLLFLTCEDSKNTIPDFQTAIRVFLITREDLADFTSLEYLRSIKVEQQKFAFRLLALHYLARGVSSGALEAGKDYVSITLPARGDEVCLSESKIVNWVEVGAKYAAFMQESRALTRLLQGEDQQAPQPGVERSP